MSLLFDYEHLMCDNKPSQVTSVKNISYFPHSHNGIEIIYIVSGDTTVTSEDECYTLRKGDIASRCSVCQFILMLPQANYENSCMVCRRIITAFNRQYPHTPARIDYAVQSLNPHE
jgi:hypothetical protein